MNIVVIANNIEDNIDGIGKHARMLSNEFRQQGHHVMLISAKSGFNRWLSIITLSMTMCFCKAVLYILNNKTHYVIIEYPFKEHNPIILIPHVLLWFVSRFKNVKIAFSMHEYDRVNALRKMVIDVFLVFSDVVFVSEKKYFDRFPRINKKIKLRTIPNHIVCDYENKDFNPNSFCYFGLVNPSKAFQEMLDAWKLFNHDGKYTLQIISSTNLSRIDFELYKGITYYYNLSSEEVVDVMFKCAFCIIPVKPNIGLNNSSFVSAIQCGCIPIGMFSEELKNEDFVINVDNYKIETLVSTYKNVSTMDLETFQSMSGKCKLFGKSFSLENTATQMINAMQ